MNHPRREEHLSSEERADLVCLATFSTLPEAHRAGTGILTMGEWYVVLSLERQWGLHVRSAIAEEASRCVREVLAEPESVAVDTPGPSFPVSARHLIPVPLLLLLVYWISTTEWGSPWVTLGRFDSQQIRFEGEWWRLLSPLFLHADPRHLVGNVLAGLLFGGMLASRIGPARTYAVALISGIAGNALNLLTFWNTPHLSIGASTAVFGLLGALVGLRLRERIRAAASTRHTPVSRKHSLWMAAGVFGAGLVLLGWLGIGGARLDVMAHFYGFMSGVFIAAVRR